MLCRRRQCVRCSNTAPHPPFLPPTSPHIPPSPLCPHTTAHPSVSPAAHILPSPEQHSAPAGCVPISSHVLISPSPRPTHPEPHSSSSTSSDQVHLPHSHPGTSLSPTISNSTPYFCIGLPPNPHISSLRLPLPIPPLPGLSGSHSP